MQGCLRAEGTARNTKETAMKTDDILTAKYYAQSLADHATIVHWTDGNAAFHEQYMRNALAKIAKAMGYSLTDITETTEASDDISIAA
jgi:hypothetical protein